MTKISVEGDPYNKGADDALNLKCTMEQDKHNGEHMIFLYRRSITNEFIDGTLFVKERKK